MINDYQSVERRQDKRFQVKDGAFVILKPADTGTGQLINISMGGLTFEHISSQAPPIEATELDIFFIGSTFTLYDIPCRKVWDLTIYENPDASLYKKQYGVQFGELTPEQIALLEYFVKNHTTGMAG